MKVTASLLVVLTSAATAVSAEGVGHKGTDITIGYDQWTVSSAFSSSTFDGTTTTARIRTDWGFGSQFGAQVNLDYSQFDIDIAPINGTATTYALHPYWEKDSSLRAGLFYQHSDFDSDFGSVGAMNYYGIEAMYSPNDALSWEVYAGVGKFEDSSGPDINSYGTTVYYAASDTFGVHMAYDREEINGGFGGGDAANSRFNFGVDYSFAGNGKMPPIKLTAEAGTVDIFGIINLDVVGAKLTVPLGGTAGANGRKLFRERGIYWAVGGAAPMFF